MKTTFVNFASEWGGGEGWTVNSLLGLKSRGHDVSLVARSSSPIAERAVRAGIQTFTLDISFDYNPKTIAKLAALYHHLGTEVVVVHFPKDVRTAGVAAKLRGLPVVHRNGFPIYQNTIRHRVTAKFVDRILTNSARIRDTYNSFGWFSKLPVDVVPNGVVAPDKPSERKPELLGFAKNDLVACYAGRLTEIKRVTDLLSAFSTLESGNRWKLAILGEGAEAANLRQECKQLKVEDRVVFHGFVDNAADLAGCADLVLLPSTDEGMPNALMEAMVRGVPVAATPVGDVPLLLDEGKAGFLLPPRNPGEWTNLLIRLEKDENLRTKMGRAGRERMLRLFSYDRMIEGIEASLLTAMGSR